MPSRRRPNKAATTTNEDDIDGSVFDILRDEIADLSRALNSKLSLLEMVVNEVKEGQQGILNSISFIDEKFEAIKKTTEKLEKENSDLNKKNQALQKQVDDVSRQVNDLDQYHRRINLEISGVPEKKEEEPEKIALQVAQKINPSITANDIDIAHRIGARKEGDHRRPRSIIVRFNNRRSRNTVYDERRKLKNVTIQDLGFQGQDRIFVNENLTGAARELLGEVNKTRSAGYRFLWTYNGKIYVKKNEAAFPIIIHGKEDMCKLK